MNNKSTLNGPSKNFKGKVNKLSNAELPIPLNLIINKREKKQDQLI